jgi:hypothetical protein
LPSSKSTIKAVLDWVLCPDTSRQTRDALIKDLKEATERAKAAEIARDTIMANIPSGLPHPDGAQRISNASREFNLALAARMKAHIRAQEFLGRAIAPDGLKLDDEKFKLTHHRRAGDIRCDIMTGLYREVLKM